MKNWKTIICFFLILFVPIVAKGQMGQEKILSFHSQLKINPDAWVDIVEDITVLSQGHEIKRGIYRDLPLAYKDVYGQRYLVEFELVGVTRDGLPERSRIEKAGNGLRIYIGKEDVFLEPGEYRYELTYRVRRVLGFFPDHDELYWNVTGNGWVFPIEKSSARVTLPEGVPSGRVEATFFTGPQGSTEQAGSFQVNQNSGVEFKTTRVLGSYEGLTVVVGWPKGYVQAPTKTENFAASFRSNLDFIAGFLGLMLLFIYYYRAWDKKGRDPKKGTIVPQYEAPRNFSPAFLRHIQKMGSDNR
jgi:hypothetical protein